MYNESLSVKLIKRRNSEMKVERKFHAKRIFSPVLVHTLMGNVIIVSLIIQFARRCSDPIARRYSYRANFLENATGNCEKYSFVFIE